MLHPIVSHFIWTTLKITIHAVSYLEYYFDLLAMRVIKVASSAKFLCKLLMHALTKQAAPLEKTRIGLRQHLRLVRPHLANVSKRNVSSYMMRNSQDEAEHQKCQRCNERESQDPRHQSKFICA